MAKKATVWAITIFTIIALPIIFGSFSQATNSASWNISQAESNSSRLVINEFMADNDGAVLSPEGNFADWIELYNASNETIDLSGMYLTNDLAHPRGWKFPNGTLIGSRGYLVIWVGFFAGKDGLNANFPLAANGGEIGLFDTDAITLIDSVEYNKQIRDVSLARVPDGSSTWQHLTKSTPNASNIPVESPEQTSTLTIAVIISAILLVSGLVIFAGKIIEKRRQEA